MGIDSVKDKWMKIIVETGVTGKEGAALIVDTLIEKAPVEMVQCKRCGSEEISTTRQCDKCYNAWNEY